MNIDTKTCRICFSSENLKPIFNNQNYQIALELFLCTSVKIIELDQLNYSALICSSCRHELNNCMLFRRKALKAEEYFQQHLKASAATNEIFERNLLEVSIKIEHPIKSEPYECDADLLQNIDTIIESCTAVHETIFEDVNRHYNDDSDEIVVRQKRKYRKRERILDDYEEELKCPQCPQKFSSRSNLNRHVIRKHPATKSKRGRKPKYVVEDEDESSDLFCEICKQFFTTRGSLQKHIKTKHEYVDVKDRYVCDSCGKSFKIKYYLIRHIKVRHLKIAEEKVKIKTKAVDSPIPCEVCGKILRNRGLLKPHMRSHQKMTPDDYYYCDLCPRKFKTRGGCTWHIQQRHILKATFKCPTCPAVYRGKWELKCHIKSKHTDIRDYRCEICGKGFLDKQKLTIHTRIHTGERPHVCHICPQTFIHQTDLRRHIWGHTGVRPYKCTKEGCGKGFMKKSELLTHGSRCHPENQARPNPIPPSQFQYQMI